MIRRPPRSTQGVSSAASDVYKRQIKYFADLSFKILISFNCAKASQTGLMTYKITRVLLLIAIASPAIAAEPFEPWPGKDQLRSIEQAAYACSRDNSTEACARVRELADPLMDHSRLPGLCKDVLWFLMDEAKVANINDFRRCLLYTSPSPRDRTRSRMPSSA